jgi:Raf kinase inhibitor-like YbhB/YbcL family protein
MPFRGPTAAARIAGALLAGVSAIACTQHEAGATISLSAPATIGLRSTAFDDGGPIPARYTCDGSNISPPLAWSEALPAQSYVLSLVDVDAPSGPFVHWVLAWSSAGRRITAGSVPPGASQGVNGFGTRAYDGPCPPPGDPAHEYVFTLYSVRGTLPDVGPGPTLADVLGSIRGSVVAKGELTGTYSRP